MPSYGVRQKEQCLWVMSQALEYHVRALTNVSFLSTSVGVILAPPAVGHLHAIQILSSESESWRIIRCSSRTVASCCRVHRRFKSLKRFVMFLRQRCESV